MSAYCCEFNGAIKLSLNEEGDSLHNIARMFDTLHFLFAGVSVHARTLNEV